jgi:hypothetical protein
LSDVFEISSSLNSEKEENKRNCGTNFKKFKINLHLSSNQNVGIIHKEKKIRKRRRSQR